METLDMFMLKKKNAQVELDITPKNPNVNNIRKHIKKSSVSNAPKKFIPSTTHIPVPAVIPQRYNGSGNPFENTRTFIMFYRAFFKSKSNNRVLFEEFTNDSLYAPQILDLMQENKCKTLEFLSFWLSNYYTHFLKGNKIFSTKHTSMKEFKKSFHAFYTIYSRNKV